MSDREAFEASIRKRYPRISLERVKDEDDYCHSTVSIAWRSWQAAIASMQGEAVAYLVRSLANKHVTGDPLEGEVFVDGYWGTLGSWRPCLPDKLHEEEFSYFYGPDKPRRRPGFEKKPLFTYPPDAAAEIARLTKELEEARKVPDGYALAPVEPDLVQVNAAIEAINGNDDLETDIRVAYKAMLSAAPDAAISKIGGGE